jgi:hypothetical protein
MDTTKNSNNLYLAIAFINGCIWGGLMVWIAPKAAIWVGMGVIIITYNTLQFFGASSDE